MLHYHQEGPYTQNWIFYNDNEAEIVNLIFSPDGEGGTNFEFLDSEYEYQ